MSAIAPVKQRQHITFSHQELNHTDSQKVEAALIDTKKNLKEMMEQVAKHQTLTKTQITLFNEKISILQQKTHSSSLLYIEQLRAFALKDGDAEDLSIPVPNVHSWPDTTILQCSKGGVVTPLRRHYLDREPSIELVLWHQQILMQELLGQHAWVIKEIDNVQDNWFSTILSSFKTPNWNGELEPIEEALIESPVQPCSIPPALEELLSTIQRGQDLFIKELNECRSKISKLPHLITLVFPQEDLDSFTSKVETLASDYHFIKLSYPGGTLAKEAADSIRTGSGESYQMMKERHEIMKQMLNQHAMHLNQIVENINRMQLKFQEQAIFLPSTEIAITPMIKTSYAARPFFNKTIHIQSQINTVKMDLEKAEFRYAQTKTLQDSQLKLAREWESLQIGKAPQVVDRPAITPFVPNGEFSGSSNDRCILDALEKHAQLIDFLISRLEILGPYIEYTNPS